MEDATPERWLPVPEYEGLYEASDLGRVRRLRPYSRPPRILKLYPPHGDNRYYTVRLCREGIRRTFTVHILVALAFLGPRPEDHEVCHGPAGPADNRLPNLSYGTRVKNHLDDKYRDGTMLMGERHVFAKLTEDIVRQCRIRKAAGESYNALACEFGVNKITMLHAVLRHTWKHVA